MAGISKEQRERDEETVALFLIFFNIVLIGAFLMIWFYRGIS